MKGISDRDKKIIIIVLILMVTILPYVFYIKNTKVDTETVKVEIETLQARYNYLLELNEKREFYEAETKRMNDERDEIIASFPAGIAPENYTMFLLQTEYSSDLIPLEETEYYAYMNNEPEDEEYELEDGTVVVIENPTQQDVTPGRTELSGELALEYPIVIDTVSYGTNIATPISTDETDTGYVALTNVSSFTYKCYYGGMKYLLAYLKEYEDPMIYTNINMNMDMETGVITGSVELSQYAVSGEGRVLPAVDYHINVGGEKVDLGLDTNDLRGNEDANAGIFGNIKEQPVAQEVYVEEETEAEE